MHHPAQLLSKDKEKITALGVILEEIRKDGRKSAAYLIRSNTELATLASENKVRIYAHLIHSNTVLATLAPENKLHKNICLTTRTYCVHSHPLNPQRSSLGTRFLLKH